MAEHDRQQHIKQLAELIRGVDIAMFTTVGADGRLFSRPLGTQEVEFDGDLWFATGADSRALNRLEPSSHTGTGMPAPGTARTAWPFWAGSK